MTTPEIRSSAQTTQQLHTIPTTGIPELFSRIKELEKLLQAAATEKASQHHTFSQQLFQQTLLCEQLTAQLQDKEKQLQFEQSNKQRLNQELALLSKQNNALRQENRTLDQKAATYEQQFPLLIEQLTKSNDRSERLEQQVAQIAASVVELQKACLDKDRKIVQLKGKDPFKSLKIFFWDTAAMMAQKFSSINNERYTKINP